MDNNYGVWDEAVMTITEGNIVYKVTASSDEDSYGDKEPIAVFATGITLDKTTAELEVGGKLTLAATLAPENVTDKTLVWTSSDETIATVKDGEVTALKAGEVTITVKNGDVEATCTITVKAAATSSEDESTASTDESSAPGRFGGRVRNAFDLRQLGYLRCAYAACCGGRRGCDDSSQKNDGQISRHKRQ